MTRSKLKRLDRPAGAFCVSSRPTDRKPMEEFGSGHSGGHEHPWNIERIAGVAHKPGLGRKGVLHVERLKDASRCIVVIAIPSPVWVCEHPRSTTDMIRKASQIPTNFVALDLWRAARQDWV